MDSPDRDEDILEAIWLTLPRLGVAPWPDLAGLDQATAEVLSYVARHAWVRAGDTLGTDYAAPAFVIAERLAHQSPQTFVEAELSTWTAAIVWLLAEDDDLVGRGKWFTATKLADTLDEQFRTLRATSKRIRDALRS
ncbi:MAG: hypothetical protein DLM58_02915 [Pseudonocardiales bacterium]|nr:MAG: hypothetical protein DLM58_02915 [Pseudonocardiales bacterium]